MMEEPWFSIVIPVYNTEAYLPRCISSARNQTLYNIEIILVDDGSTDGSGLLCDQYEAEDARIRVIHKKNGGLSDARNAGIRAATGRYILLLDSDDCLTETACEDLLPAAKTGSNVIVGCWAKKEFAEPEMQIWQPQMYIKQKLQTGRLDMAAVLYLCRRDFLLEKGLLFQYGILHEDEAFTPRVLLEADQLAVTNVGFYHYILRAGSITRQKDLRKNAEDLYNTCRALEKRYQTLDDILLSRLLRDSLTMKILSLFQDGRLYQYGKEYIYKEFVLRNAFSLKNRCKACLFWISPKCYWHINHFVKGLK